MIRRRTRPTGVFATYGILLATTYLLYVAKVGGDFMGLFRFIMPMIVLIYMLGVVGLWLLLGDRKPAIAIGVVAALLAAHVAHAIPVTRDSLVIGADHRIDSPGYLRWYTADRAVIGKWFGQYAQPDDYMVVGGAGAQVWYSGIASLDAFGLSDEYIAHKVPANNNRPGHQKYAPVDYQLARHPTIITSSYYKLLPTPYVPTAADIAEWKPRNYHYVSIEMPGLSSKYYVFLKRRDRTIGPLGPDVDPPPPPTDQEP